MVKTNYGEKKDCFDNMHNDVRDIILVGKNPDFFIIRNSQFFILQTNHTFT
jgi:hypothetical protein